VYVTVTAQRLCDLSGVTYRQCDYWTGNGWLRPSAWREGAVPPGRNATWTPTLANPGSGRARLYAVAEVSVAYVMRYLIEDAHLSVARSALVARGYVEDGQRAFDLAEHVTVTLSLELPAWPVEPPAA
jgi:hypothetical protein